MFDIPPSSRCRWFVASLLLAWISAAPCAAQITVQGVYVDTKNVLRYRKTVPGGSKRFRKDRSQDPALCYISLPKLFAEVQALVQAGKPIPDRMRYLDGMVRLTHVFVDPEAKDLIIAGPAETIAAATSQRPRGQRTGRPVLQLDDLVVALRSVGPGSRTRVFGCTLVQDAGSVDRVAAFQAKIRRLRNVRQDAIAAGMKQAVGPLAAKFFGVPADSRFALTCVEADYLMKRLSLGLDRSPVSGMKSYLERSTGGNAFNRFWFTANYQPLLVSADGNSFELQGPGLQVLASTSPTKVVSQNPGATAFAADFTKHFVKLEDAVPAFADLHNLADLAVASALIAEDRLHERIEWNMDWVLDSQGYPVTKVRTPRQAETLVNYRIRGRLAITVAGGVQVAVDKAGNT